MKITNKEKITDNIKDKKSILMLAGRGIEEESIKKYVSEKCLEKQVMFLGVRNDIPDLMNLFDVFLFPSFYEGLGIVGIEAQAAGLLCIFSDNMTKETKVLETTEFLSLSKDEKKWANEEIKAVKGYKRNDTIKEISNNGFKIKK